MYRRRSLKPMIITMSALMIVALIGIAYSVFTGQLNITGSAVGRQSNWDVHFENVSNMATTGTAKVLSNHQPVINSNNPTQLQDYEVSLTSPSDSISFTFDVVNDGNYNAKITSVNVGTPQCTSTDTTSATNMCNNLTYTLTYSSGSSIQTNDVIYAKDKATMKVTLTFNEISNASLLPTAGVSISNLGIQINFEQQGNALVQDNGEVINTKVYHQGDKITLNNEDYWVITYSPVDQDYVVALKDEPLTVNEVNTYGESISITATNINGYGGMSYYTSETCSSNNTSECTTDYSQSKVKIVVDAWVANKYQNNELKVVDNYYARLITASEYNSLSAYNWRYSSSYTYWIMSQYVDPKFMNVIINNGSKSINYTYGAGTVIRPVINVYKSAIDTNNNE